ncbi:uncharacterized protein LOC143291485 isoform X2 [Babylonia areolata]|uniref:uncharacterized protein LOC143291485 isoform X2 n=1 Tax=Babylonia areolata TaxID=304850 RepID=UPI003FD07E54
MIINDLYDTSDNCQMITNTLYQGAGRMGVVGTGGSSLYEDVDQARGRNLPPRPYRSPGVDVGDYVDQEEIRRTERKQRNQQPETDAAEAAVYVDREEIRRKKRKQRNQQPETDAAEAAVYVDREEIRRKKRKQRNQQPD